MAQHNRMMRAFASWSSMAVLSLAALLMHTPPTHAQPSAAIADAKAGAQKEAANSDTGDDGGKKSKKPKRAKAETPVDEDGKLERKSRKTRRDEALVDPEQDGKRRQVTMTLKQMGAWSSISLRGRLDEQTLVVPIRSDEVVVSAKLRIAYDYSSALLPELSQLKVSVNGRAVATEALLRGKGLGNTREIEIDPRLFQDTNYLQFMFMGQLPGVCVDPYHPALWLVLSEKSRLELTLAPVSQTQTLKSLPMPFFDPRETTPLNVPFVFAKSPSAATVQAAGTVASWFGVQARNRTVQFPVRLNELPSGNAVLMLLNGQSVDGIKGLPNATVSLLPHPRDEYAKVLLVTGNNEEELARAAQAVALQLPVLNGPSANVPKATPPAPRKPYDAPAWIPTDRVVHLGELMRGQEMQARAYFPDAIRVNFRLPPDLFAWRTAGVPLELKYRGTNLPTQADSSVNVSLNSNFIAALPLNGVTPKTKDDHLENRQALVHLPPYASMGRDQLQFQYYFDINKKGECRDLPPANLEGAIDPQSTLDFSAFPHYAALPNLATFASMGYPYTRLADLAETAVVISDQPTAEELGLYLALMGRMGEATGYPALRHLVVPVQEVDKAATRDLIVISSASNQSLMSKWKDALPLVMVDGERNVRESRVSWRSIFRWAEADLVPPPAPAGTMNLSGLPSLVTIMAFESPLQSSRSVVFFYADQSADLRKISDALTDPDRLPQIQGDFVVVDDKSITYARVAQTYFVGSLPVVNRLHWLLTAQPLLLAGLVLLVCVALAALLYRPLRQVVPQWVKKARQG